MFCVLCLVFSFVCFVYVLLHAFLLLLVICLFCRGYFVFCLIISCGFFVLLFVFVSFAFYLFGVLVWRVVFFVFFLCWFVLCFVPCCSCFLCNQKLIPTLIPNYSFKMQAISNPDEWRRIVFQGTGGWVVLIFFFIWVSLHSAFNVKFHGLSLADAPLGVWLQFSSESLKNTWSPTPGRVISLCSLLWRLQNSQCVVASFLIGFH